MPSLPHLSRLAVLLAFASIRMASAEYYYELTASTEPAYQEPETTAFDVPGPNAGIKIQGIIFCRKGGKLFPLAGAMARITCATMEYEGFYYESAPFSVVSRRTDSNGYFLINLSLYDEMIFDLESCKVFLETPPPGICNIPTNVNNGITGAPLPPTFRFLKNKYRIYSVPPLVYTTQSY